MKKDTASKLFIVPFHTLRLTNLLLLGGKLRRKINYLIHHRHHKMRRCRSLKALLKLLQTLWATIQNFSK